MSTRRYRIVSALLAAALVGPPGWAAGIEQNDPPVISHTPPGVGYRGQPIPIYARVTDSTGKVRKVKLFYALSQQQAPVEVAMERVGRDRYSGLIPANFFASMSKVWYYIEARDSYDDDATTTWYPVVIKDPSRERTEDPAAEEAAEATPKAGSGAPDAATSTAAPATGSAGPAGTAFPEGATSAAEAPGGGIGAGGTIGIVLVGGALGGLAVGSSGGGGGGGDDAVPCNSTTVPGGDTPETHTISLGQSSGTFVFNWDTYAQPDRILVRYEGAVLFDSGCVGSSGSETLAFDGGSSKVTVEVIPNCAGGSGTAWEFTLQCP